jgi:hypothetical protein
MVTCRDESWRKVPPAGAHNHGHSSSKTEKDNGVYMSKTGAPKVVDTRGRGKKKYTLPMKKIEKKNANHSA